MVPELSNQLRFLFLLFLHVLKEESLYPRPPLAQDLLPRKVDNVVPEGDISEAMDKSKVGRQVVKYILIQQQGGQPFVVAD